MSKKKAVAAAEPTKIESLTPEQEALIPTYVERYRQIGLDTSPTEEKRAAERVAGEAAIKKAYAYMKLKEPEIFWESSPYAGAKLAAQMTAGSLDVTKEQISEQASKASFGSTEAYWVVFYAYIAEVLPVKCDELIDIVKEITNNLGAYWAFEDAVVLTPKPVAIHMPNGKLTNTTGMAVEYPDGTGLFSVEGTVYNSLAELILANQLKEGT